MSPAIKARDFKGPSSDGSGDGAPLIPFIQGEDVAHSLRADGFDASEDGSGRGTPIVPVAFRKSRRAQNANDDETWVDAEVSNTLNGFDVGERDTHAVCQKPVAFQASGDRNDPSISVSEDCAFTIPANPMSDRGQAVGVPAMSFKPGQSASARSLGCDEHTAPTLEGGGGGNNKPAVCVRSAIPINGMTINKELRDKQTTGIGQDGDPMVTLRGSGTQHAVGVDCYNHSETGDVAATVGANSGGTNTAGPKVLAFAQNQLGEVRTGDVSGTLNQNGNATGRNSPLVAFGWQNSQSQGISASEHHTPTLDKSKTPAIAFQPGNLKRGAGADPNEEVFPTLRGAKGRGCDDQQPHVAAQMRVRRLTPRECERLQGFPDDWTLVEYRGKPAADGPRYKAIGNSMAVSVMAWIGRRIVAQRATIHDGSTGGPVTA